MGQVAPIGPQKSFIPHDEFRPAFVPEYPNARHVSTFEKELQDHWNVTCARNRHVVV
jgi:hypothetical protein